MPITNGNYVAPAWVNNAAPAINDAELLAMSGTLVKCQILNGSGPPTQYTSGVVGQLYVDGSTTPKTIYQCLVSASEANVWSVSGDPNVNLAEEYDPTGTYAAGDYCIHGGLLYRAKNNINNPEAWTASHWDRAWLANDLKTHEDDTGNPHEVTKAQVGLGNLDNVLQYSASNPPTHIGTITLSTTWTGAVSPYSQEVTVTGATVTENSKVDFQPTPPQISSLITDGVTALLIENDDGYLTVYAFGATPAAAITLQCTIEEVEK